MNRRDLGAAWVTAVLGAAAVGCTLPSVAADLAPEILTFPTEKLLHSKAQFAKTIDEVGGATQPNVKFLAAGVDLTAVLRNEYGDAAPLMWPAIRKANRGSTASSLLDAAPTLPSALVLTAPIENFVLPVGPQWRLKSSVVTTSKNDTLDSLAAHYLGATTDNLTQARAELQRANPGVNFSTLNAGAPVTLPQISYPRIARPSSAAVDLGDIPGAHSEGQIAPLHPVLPITTNCKGEGQTWPVNWDAVMQVMQFNRGKNPQLADPDRTVVAVMDSGVAPNEDDAQRIHFWHGGRDEGIGYDETTRDGNGHPQTPWQNFQSAIYRDHGTLVAGLIQGGATTPANRQELKRFSSVMVLKVVGGGPYSAVVPVDAIGSAISDGLAGHASVFNISIAPSAFQSAWEILKQHEGTLFVVAAGNGRPESNGDAVGYVLDREELEPAELGGARSANVVSVAAHGSDGALPKFSNRGKETVTLAAPGCVIRSFVPTATGTDASNGTSFAAPLVSAAAAILASYHLSAREIKERLIASVEWDPDLDDFLFSGGLFSFEKALNVYADIVVAKPLKDGGTVERGILTTDRVDGGGRYVLLAEGEKPVQQFEVALDHVLKLTVVGMSNDGAPRVRMMWEVPGASRTLRSEIVKIQSLLSFRADGALEARPLSMRVRLDIVPGSRLTNAARIADLSNGGPPHALVASVPANVAPSVRPCCLTSRSNGIQGNQ
jgi:phage tail protein X